MTGSGEGAAIAGFDGSAAGLTQRLAARACALTPDDVSEPAVTLAKQCLLDWLGVTLAARREPLVNILAGICAEELAPGACTIIGRGDAAAPSHAVLLNGTMGHALDYDDVIDPMGHPSVCVAPVAFALAERDARSGQDLLTAFITGVETECRLALLLGSSHYARGWHGTATFGTFGAAAAAGWLLGLSAAGMAHAFGLAATQAAGLKAMFGTMAKPLHAGKAAANGLLAARLAQRGFTANPQALEADQGFGRTQSDAIDPAAALTDPPGGFHLCGVRFKYQAACFMTHSTIAAAQALRRDHGLQAKEIAAITVRVDRRCLGVCAIADPANGLEAKFSLGMAAALALAGEDTALEATFCDANTRRPDLIALRRRVRLEVFADETGAYSEIEVRLSDGRLLAAAADVSRAVMDSEAQWTMLETKFRALTVAALGADRCAEVIGTCRGLDACDDVGSLAALVRG